jgi:hypothetical protein
MKKLILLLSLVICMQGIETKAQEWAPDGAEWYYDYVNFYFAGYVHVTVAGDTMIHDTACRILNRFAVIHNQVSGTTNYINHGNAYMYSDTDNVYLYENNKFYTLFDFSATIGDTIIIPQNSNIGFGECDSTGKIHVIDTGTMIINGENLRWIYVSPTDDSHWSIHGHIVEKIGPLNSYMLPEPNICVIDLYEGGPLRCYSDPAFGLYNTGISPECDYLVSVPEMDEKEIQVYPNPASGTLTINTPGNRSHELRLYNSNGMEIMSRHLSQSHKSIDVSGLRPGLYYIRIESGNEVINRLVVIQ